MPGGVAPPPPPFSAPPAQFATTAPLASATSPRKGPSVGVITAIVGAFLVCALLGVILVKSRSNSSAKPAEVPVATTAARGQATPKNTPNTTASTRPTEVTIAGGTDTAVVTTVLTADERQLIGYDLTVSDVPNSLDRAAGLLFRPCSGIDALADVETVSPGATIDFKAMEASSQTGKFAKEADASAWFTKATAIKVGCTFDHGSGFVETITSVTPGVLANGTKIVAFGWKVDQPDKSVIVGEDHYLVRGAFIGVVNCQADQPDYVAADCKRAIDIYEARFSKPR